VFFKDFLPLLENVARSGAALLRCQKGLEAVKAEGDMQIGINIVKRALEEPMRQIAWNAGREGSIVVEKVKERRRAPSIPPRPAATCTERLSAEGYFRERLRPLPFFMPRLNEITDPINILFFFITLLLIRYYLRLSSLRCVVD